MLGPNTWIDHALHRARHALSCGAPLAIITDGRFANEVEVARQAGAKALRIVAPSDARAAAIAHASEVEQDSIWTDATVYNDKAAPDGLAEFKALAVCSAELLLSTRRPFEAHP